MASLLQQFEVVRRHLASGPLSGAELEQVADAQAKSLRGKVEKIKHLSLADKATLCSAVAEVPFAQASKDLLVKLINDKPNVAAKKRELQDYCSWPSYGTRYFWDRIADNPELAVELICQHVHTIGLINPTKETQRSLAACATAASTGDGPFTLLTPQDQPQHVFKVIGQRLKQLYKQEPLHYITKLPASPADFYRQYPVMANIVYSIENLPCACPLDQAKVGKAESMIACRGKLAKKEPAGEEPEQLQTMMSFVLKSLQNMQRLQQQGGRQQLEQGLTLLPPGTLAGQQCRSPAPKRFALTDGAADLPPQLPGTPGSTTSAGSPPPRDGDAAPRCHDVLGDGPAKPGEVGDDAKALRESVVEARRKLLADRAAAAAAAKTARKGKAKAAKAPKSKAKAKGKKKGKRAPRRDAVPMHRNGKAKPASWLKARPSGCATCRNCPGCTKSCYIKRGEKVPS